MRASGVPLSTLLDADKTPIGKSAVQSPIDAKKRLQGAGLGHNQRERLERQVEVHEPHIDELVYKLYGLSADDIRVVQDATKK